MTIEISIKAKELSYKSSDMSKDINGNGMAEFLAFIQKYGKMIDRVDLNGQSYSYTFSRQVFLAVNLLKSLTDCSVYYNGKRSRLGLILPVYK
jgi:hypothetical protein